METPDQNKTKLLRAPCLNSAAKVSIKTETAKFFGKFYIFPVRRLPVPKGKGQGGRAKPYLWHRETLYFAPQISAPNGALLHLLWSKRCLFEVKKILLYNSKRWFFSLETTIVYSPKNHRFKCKRVSFACSVRFLQNHFLKSAHRNRPPFLSPPHPLPRVRQRRDKELYVRVNGGMGEICAIRISNLLSCQLSH